MLDRAEFRIVAALAKVDERTLRRVLDGHAPRSLAVRDAIVRALRERGHKDVAAKLAAEGTGGAA